MIAGRAVMIAAVAIAKTAAKDSIKGRRFFIVLVIASVISVI